MIVISAFVFGALFGWMRARNRKGNRLDMVQYAAIFGILFAIIGLFVTLILERML